MSETPSDVDELRAALAEAHAVISTSEAMITALKLEIALLRRDKYGRSAERGSQLSDQLELGLAESLPDDSAADGETEHPPQKTTTVVSFERRKPVKKTFPDHLPRERVMIEAPTRCSCCGSSRIVKMGEDVTDTIEVVPRQWKVIQTVREKFTCRDCEKISQPPAPFHPLPRGWAGPSLLAMLVFEKYGQHQPLNRQAERYAREGVDLSLSTLADQIGAVAELLKPLNRLIEDHVMRAGRLHGDDTPLPLLARGGTKTARLWTYVRDDRPFSGAAPPGVVFKFSRDRSGDHPADHLRGWQGLLQADAYAGYNQLYDGTRDPSPVLPVLCWSHARRKFFELADVEGNIRKGKPDKPISPIALEAVKRTDALFAIERKSWLFAGSERGGQRAAAMYTLIGTAKLNNIDPQAWLADVIARISDLPISRLPELLPWNWEGPANQGSDQPAKAA